MTALCAIMLGALQGLTEFLPVSSSAHLMLFPVLLGGEAPPLLFDVVVHFGTLVSAVVFLRADVADILRALARLARRPGQWRQEVRDDPWAKLALLVVAGSVPTAIIGLAGHKLFEQMFETPLIAAGALLITAALLLVTDAALRRRGGAESEGSTTWGRAALVGIAQGLAIVPGISRSGATMCSGILLGLPREFAFRFAFLLMIPAVFGAALFEARGMAAGDFQWTYVVGALVAFAVGLAALSMLRAAVIRGRLWVFGVYCIVIAAVGCYMVA